MGHPSEELSKIQAWMQSSLIDSEENKSMEFIDHYIASTEKLTPRQGLAIYQRSYYSRLIECMRGQFKALCYTLGNELFDDFARLYLKQHPSRSPSLSHLGEQFPAYLQEARPDKAAPERWIDFMIFMAQFECDLYRIFDQKGSEGELFANENSLDENLMLQACFSLKRYPFQVNQYYQEVAAENNPEIPPEQIIHIAFVRTNFQVYIYSLTNIQFALLDLLQNGENIPSSLELLIQQFNLIPAKVAERWLEWKNEWIKKGFFLEKPV